MASRIRIRPVSSTQLKQDVQIPQALQAKSEKRPFEDGLHKCVLENVKKVQPLKRKKLSLQEYKLRKGVGSNNSSATMRQKTIFPVKSSRLSGKVVDGFHNSLDQVDDEQNFVDPIKEAGNRTLMRLKKQKAEANRRREEAIIKSRLRNVENFQIQPLMPAEMMKLLGITQSEILPEPMGNPQVSVNYEVKKSDHVLKENLFDNVTRDMYRKPTVSESSDPSSSSSSTSSGYNSGYTTSSRKSQGSSSLHERDEIYNQKGYRSYSSNRENNTPVDERKIVFVGRLQDDVTKQKLGNEFSKFGRVVKVGLHSNENGTRYGFVTYERARDAWSAVKAAGTFAQYDVRFGAHCAFFRQSDADLDGSEAKFKKNAYHGQEVPPSIQ